jgi:hypothetical protein
MRRKTSHSPSRQRLGHDAHPPPPSRPVALGQSSGLARCPAPAARGRSRAVDHAQPRRLAGRLINRESERVEWATQDLRPVYDYLAPSCSTEIRLLPNLPRGEIVHATAPAYSVSEPAYSTTSPSSSTSWTGAATSGVRPAATTRSPSLCRVAASRCRRLRRSSTGLAHSRSLSSSSRLRVGSASGGVAPRVEGGPRTSSATDRRRAASRLDGGPLISARGSTTRHPMVRRSAPCSRWTPAGLRTALSSRGPVPARCGTGRSTRSGSYSAGMGRSGEAGRVATSFQFKVDGASPLRIGIGTFPKWPGGGDADPVDGRW